MLQKAPSAGIVSGAFDKVYDTKELAELWHLSPNSIRRLFENEPGVFRMGNSTTRRGRPYVTLRIPHTVAVRVWRERAQ